MNPVMARLAELREKLCIFVSVTSDDRNIEVRPDTSLNPGKMPPGTVLNLYVDIRERRQLEPFVVHRAQLPDGNHRFDLLTPVELPGDILRYSFPVELRGQGRDGVAKWSGNQIQVIHVFQRGRFVIEQVSIATQDFVNFLRIQWLYEGQVVRKGNKLVVDDKHFQPWNNMIEILVNEMRRRKIGEAVDEKVYLSWEGVSPGVIYLDAPPPRFLYDNLAPNTAVIQFWNDSMGYGWCVANLKGFSRLRDGLHQAKIHFLGGKGPVFRHYEDGAILTFKDAIEAEHVAGPDMGLPRCELKGFRPL